MDKKIEQKVIAIMNELSENFEKYGGGRLPYLHEFYKKVNNLGLKEEEEKKFGEIFNDKLIEIDKNRPQEENLSEEDKEKD